MRGKMGFYYSCKPFISCTIYLSFHFFIILSYETSLSLSSFFLSSVLLRGCQSHGNHFLPPNQPQNKKNTHTHQKKYIYIYIYIITKIKKNKNKKTHNHRRDEERTNKVKIIIIIIIK